MDKPKNKEELDAAVKDFYDKLPPDAKNVALMAGIGAAAGSVVPIIGTGIGATAGAAVGLVYTIRKKLKSPK